MWEGYLKDPKSKQLLECLARKAIPVIKCHTSGHASVRDLLRLRKAFHEAVVVPIHTEHPNSFEGLFGNVEIHNDGDWWEIL